MLSVKELGARLLDEAVEELFPRSLEARRLSKLPRRRAATYGRTRGWRPASARMRHTIARHHGDCPVTARVALLDRTERSLLVLYIWPLDRPNCQVGFVELPL